ncbi:probable ATP-dependent RNA helicase CG8611 [Fopius arisanus]|uniref:ATP-dependent RNA helicase n=1 Tax=Fopius arisanus TaxID=64838 RepID=A0A9R1T413_9HYME|nr:PREDICTED: probable ATP-dependent RNA helicase CG8611 [Fopius arisanus]XP_011302394.1 PREDICTED: probable ATP-dependent RNA helicase CG8611 [Fopius arisanus]XP_011302395.1 PREDICTED: probable ATP-dependent RNA helicase CG8611 [Fopius arisanus]
MAVQDMDICLNVSSGTVNDQTSKGSSKKSKFFKPHITRLSKAKLTDNNSQVKTNVNDRQSGISNPRKRIKQKSLALIVAQNRNKVNQSNPKVEKLEEENGVKTRELKRPVVTFAKPSETGLKTILAKPRQLNSSGKSLADIFAKSSSDGTSGKGNDDSGKSLAEIFAKKNNAGDKQGDTQVHKLKFLDRERGKKSKKLNQVKDVASTPDEKPNRTFSHSGKVSSLFGNNPDVPTIGQRLVKPVQETVFSKTKFSDLEIHPFMVSNLEQNMNISNMTTVQQKAIPEIFTGKDILVRSQTGSGKTLAYALPIVELLHKIRPKLKRDDGIRALIVVPTRELALQTYECFLKLIKPFTWIVPGYLVGGEKRKAEKARLRRGCTILIATPGRLLDHIKHTEALKLTNVKCFVLDEADRMLDMGYERDISGIVSALKVKESDSVSSNYDPLSMLRQNRKIVFNDDDPEKDEKSVDEDEIKEAEEPKRQYHSESDSETESQEFSVKEKKLSEMPQKPDESHQQTSKEIASGRQTILLSATLTNAVEKLAGLTMTSPTLIDAAEENLRKAGGSLTEINDDLVVPQGVIQNYIVTPPKLRMVTLCAYIAARCQTPGQHKILIFMATQDMIDFYGEILPLILKKPTNDEDEDSDPLVDVEFFKLHGSMSQKERTDIFKTFRQAHSGVLLCTDVAARGLDMPKVDTVVQYTGPLSARDYVHRIGRTARAGTSGNAIIFLTPPEIEFVRALESRRIRIKQVDMKDVLDKLIGPFSKHLSVEATATELQNRFENLVIDDKKFHNMACRAYVSWMRFYSSYPRDMREIFNRKDLHLGHYAKSFALRDPPKRIGGIGKTLRENNPSRVVHNNRLSNERVEKVRKQQSGQPSGHKPGMLKRSRILNVSEYGDGLEPIKKIRKK